MVKVQHVDHVAITVRDLARSIRWYSDTLGLEDLTPGDWDYPRMIGVGDTCLALFPSSVEEPRNLSQEDVAKTITMRHVAFRVDGAGFKQAQEEFRAKKVDFEFADHGVAHSVYISDPDGHRIEITTYDL